MAVLTENFKRTGTIHASRYARIKWVRVRVVLSRNSKRTGADGPCKSMQGLNGDLEVLTINSKRTGAMHHYIEQETGDSGKTGRRRTVLRTLTNGDNR